jgi:hypothetical protein
MLWGPYWPRSLTAFSCLLYRTYLFASMLVHGWHHLRPLDEGQCGKRRQRKSVEDFGNCAGLLALAEERSGCCKCRFCPRKCRICLAASRTPTRQPLFPSTSAKENGRHSSIQHGIQPSMSLQVTIPGRATIHGQQSRAVGCCSSDDRSQQTQRRKSDGTARRRLETA